MTDTDEFPAEPSGWLSDAELKHVRSELPLLYVDIVPVRVNAHGEVAEVGLLLRGSEGMISRTLVSGRVMYFERIRDALIRNIEKDLGPAALPRVPLTPQPFSIAEYFPRVGITAFHDPRQHAVALAFVVPVDGDCQPQQNALDIAWLTPEEAGSEDISLEMTGGQDVLLRRALAYCGVLP